MSRTLASHYLEGVLKDYRKLKLNAEKAIAQVNDRDFFALPSPESNSIAIVMKHMAGNMRSRWTDFLTSDGEKPDRQRDREFEIEDADSRAALEERWEQGWQLVFDAIGPLKDGDLMGTVLIRGEAHTVLEAVQRQLAHYSAHVGQIIYLARYYQGPKWKTLSIPKGQSEAFNLAMRSKRN